MSNKAPETVDDSIVGGAKSKARYSAPKLTALGDFRTITASGSGAQSESPGNTPVTKKP